MLSLICGVKLDKKESKFSSSKFYQHLLTFNYDTLLDQSDAYKLILKQTNEILPEKFDSSELASVGIACLQQFIQSNWTGPLKKDKITSDESYIEKIEALLSIDGETIYSNFINIHLFYMAKLILIDLAEKIRVNIEFFDWWSLRCVYVYQQLFEERTSTLTSKAMDLISSLEQQLNDTGSFEKICFHLETGYIYYQCYNWTKGEQSFHNAIKQSAFNYELSGAFGKRTRFQVNDIAQLILKIKIDNSREYEFLNGNFDLKLLPKNLSHNDDTVLEKVKLKDDQDVSMVNLTPLDQAILYCILFNHQKNTPKDELTAEELSTFIETLLSDARIWSIQTCCLFLRAKLEAKKTRKAERSLMQLENLVDNFRECSLEAKHRQQLFYQVNYPCLRVVKLELARAYMDLGCINSALEIYLEFNSWENVIKCYITLEKREKAETLIRKQLELKETAELYCYLGEVTRDTQYYEKAIEISNGKSAKAYRMIAKHHFSREEYEASIVNFEKSLQINYMQYDAWFMLGNAAFRSEKWDVAARAFRQCTTLDPDSHETWNNLAAAYIKNNQKDKAHTILQEAIKQDYENWKVWENYLWTSTDCGYFEDVVRAYHRLLDLKEKYTDLDVLRILCQACEQNLVTSKGQPIIQLKSKILQLFGRISSAVVCESRVYWYYAKIVFHFGQINEQDPMLKSELSDENADKAFTLLQKSLRCLINQPNWEQTIENCNKIIEASINILLDCLNYGSSVKNPRELFASFKLNIKSIISKLKQKYGTSDSDELVYCNELNAQFEQLQNNFNEFLAKFF